MKQRHREVKLAVDKISMQLEANKRTRELKLKIKQAGARLIAKRKEIKMKQALVQQKRQD